MRHRCFLYLHLEKNKYRIRRQKFRMGGRAVECGGLAYESARQTQCRRARTSGEQHRQVRSANKTVGWKTAGTKKKFRMGGRAVECGGLENRWRGNSSGGSNPSPSASILGYTVSYIKSPQFCGIFHELTLVYAKIAPFYAIIFCFLYNPPFSDSQWSGYWLFKLNTL